MKNWKYYILFVFIIFLSTCNFAYAQSVTKISQRCPAPNGSTFGIVQVVALGDIVYNPCVGRSSIFTGNVDFSGATVVGSGFVTGTGTANFIPRWTGASALGNTPQSWNGTSFVQNNTALTATFLNTFTPSSTVGRYTVGDATTFLDIVQATTTISNQLAPATGVWNVTDATNFSLIFNASTDRIIANNTTNSFALDFDARSTGYFKVGDYTATPLNYFSQDYTSGITNIVAVDTISLRNEASTISFIVSPVSNNITAFATSGMIFRSVNEIKLGDVTASANGLYFSVDDSAKTFLFNTTGSGITYTFEGSSGNDAIFDLNGIINYNLQRTITAAGTTGAQIINKPNGTVNFAGGATAIVVTNSIASTTSTIIVTQQDTDATCLNPIVDAKAAGSFTIRFAVACTAETPVAFWVFN